jgi:hypothetical protein
MAELLRQFVSLHNVLRRIESNLPSRVDLPIIQFTDALGKTMPLPYELCQKWATFRELLRVVFINKSGSARVETEQYFIMYAQGGRLLREASWQHTIKRDDHLSMSMILSELSARQGRCPFPAVWRL